jgi:SAM-dependent methyltransferase
MLQTKSRVDKSFGMTQTIYRGSGRILMHLLPAALAGDLKTVARRTWGIRAFYKKVMLAGVINYLAYYLDKELQGCTSVLDLGCGQSSWPKVCSVPYSVGVDIFEPSLKESKRQRVHTEYLRADVRELQFKERVFDAVVALEVIEHLTKEEGRKLVSNMERWARKKVIVSTPKGYVPRNPTDNSFQRHMSGWDIAELKQLGFKVKGACGWSALWTSAGSIRVRPEIMGQTITSLTSIVLHDFPQVSFDLFCVKTLT